MLNVACSIRCLVLQAYFDLYNTTVCAIKAVDRLIPVGGPATAALAWVKEFADWTSGGKVVPADFISSHL